MSVLLMGAVKAFVREQFTAQQVLTVDYYGGEFSAEEVAFSGQPVPAVLIAGLGWTPPRGNERMVGNTVRVCHMAAFVVTKDGGRAERMLAAQALAEQLDLALTMWRPADQAGPLEVVGPEPGVRAENVYNRKIDAKGLALWLISWRQCVRPRVPLPELFDLLSLDIRSTAQTLPSNQPQPTDNDLVVTHELQFQPPI